MEPTTFRFLNRSLKVYNLMLDKMISSVEMIDVLCSSIPLVCSSDKDHTVCQYFNAVK